MKPVSRRSFLYVLGGIAAARVIPLDAASSGPAMVMLMRHGEDIGENSYHLSPEGMKRAQALPRLFGTRLPRPDVIVATHASKNSNRPIETVEPLARALGLDIDHRFRQDDFAILARDLLTDRRFAGKVVLVCWHHG
jgi:phosphohistidine phosphatase SixA